MLQDVAKLFTSGLVDVDGVVGAETNAHKGGTGEMW